MADKVVLYSYFRSSATWRVRIALALKDVKYEYRAVNLIKDEQFSEDYKKINPMSVVPSLEIDGHVLTQSLPIIEYLDQKYPEPALLPKDAYGKAQVQALSELVNSGIQPLQNPKVLRNFGDKSEEMGRFYVEKGFTAIERLLEKTAGTYCYGDQVSMADLCLVPQVHNASHFKVDMTQFPIISRVNEKLVQLPAFVAADLGRQPDTPEEMRKN